MKVAIVHEWLETYAGSERVLEQLLTCWPQADLFAVCDFMDEEERMFLRGRKVQTSFIQRLPGAQKHFRKFLGLMPIAVEQFDLSGYDLVVSSSHAVAKGVITGPGTLHVSYVHSPMRYAWDLQHQYLRQSNMERGLKGLYARRLLARMREWDQMSAARPDILVANSSYIAARIEKCWRRPSEVIHPPVDLEGFLFQEKKQDYFLIASRIVPYKRMELVAQAFAHMPDRKLIVVGDGPSADLVKREAAGAPNIELRGRVGQSEFVALMQGARAAIFAAEEDFGISTVEAQACGTPVIAFGKGGACDIVRPGVTGLLFREQSAESIRDAVARFEALETPISAAACRANAERFSREKFRERMTGLVERHIHNVPGGLCA